MSRLFLVCALTACLGAAAISLTFAQSGPSLSRRVTFAAIARDGFAPPPPPAAPAPPAAPVDNGPIVSVYLGSGAVLATSPVERRDTRFESGQEYFENPTAPHFIVHYPRFGVPGRPGANTILAAHVNYLGFGPGPFASIAAARIGDTLTLAMSDGTAYTFTVQSVDIIPLSIIDMDAVVFPALASTRERATLISCGGTCIPNGAGCDYDSRVVLVAERFLD